MTRLPCRCVSSSGTLRIPKGWVSSTPPLQGMDEDGNYRTSASEVYVPLTCERLSLS